MQTGGSPCTDEASQNTSRREQKMESEAVQWALNNAHKIVSALESLSNALNTLPYDEERAGDFMRVANDSIEELGYAMEELKRFEEAE